MVFRSLLFFLLFFSVWLESLVGISKYVVRDKVPFKLSKLLISLLLATVVGGVPGVLTNGVKLGMFSGSIYALRYSPQ